MVGEIVYIKARVEKVLDDGSLMLAIDKPHSVARVIAPADAVAERTFTTVSENFLRECAAS